MARLIAGDGHWLCSDQERHEDADDVGFNGFKRKEDLMAVTTNSACSVVKCGPMGRLKMVEAIFSAIGNAPRFKFKPAYAPERWGGTG